MSRAPVAHSALCPAQGLMFGYATDETEECMPLTVILAHKLNIRMADLRRSGALPWLRPDSKTQVSPFLPLPVAGALDTHFRHPQIFSILVIVKVKMFILGIQRIVDFEKNYLFEKPSDLDVFSFHFIMKNFKNTEKMEGTALDCFAVPMCIDSGHRLAACTGPHN